MKDHPMTTSDEARAGFSPTDMTRFWSNVDRKADTECWSWLGRTHGGYGDFWLNGRGMRCHRASYILNHGPIAPGLVIDHVCRNRSCVNPAHLRAVTPKQNTLENSSSVTAINAAKTHCIRGHPLTPDNLDSRGLKLGWRQCKACKNAFLRRYRAQLKEAANG
jgi:hypothetical protein